MKTCFFIGHREDCPEVFPALMDVVKHHITEFGVKEFIVGNYGGFDRIVAKAVIAAKTQYPEITLSMLIPYHPAERPVNLPPGFDNTFYPQGMEKVPRRLAIVRANRYMIMLSISLHLSGTRQVMHGIYWNTPKRGSRKN